MERIESLGEILRRLQQKNLLQDSQIPSSVADFPEIDPAEPTCPKCGGRGWVKQLVPVTHPEFGKAYLCECQAQANAEVRLERLHRIGNLGMLGQVRFANTEPLGRGPSEDARNRFKAAFESARIYASAPRGWYILTGASGRGKTHLAAAIANQCAEAGMPAFFAAVPDLLDHLRSTFSPQSEFSYDMLFQEIKDIPLLVLDDLGAQGSTQWAEEKLFQVINYRFVNSLATVVTTNLPITRLDDRLQSRMTDPLHSQVIDLGILSNTDASGFGSINPEMRASMTFENFDMSFGDINKTQREKDVIETALHRAKVFSSSPLEGWFVLKGKTYTGKTHLAVAIADKRIREGDRVFFTSIPELLDYLRYTFNPDNRASYDERFDEVKNAPLLILDDWGAAASTKWAEEKLYQLFVYRYSRKIPTVITMKNHNDLGEGYKRRLLDFKSIVTFVDLDEGKPNAVEPEIEKPRSKEPRSF